MKYEIVKLDGRYTHRDLFQYCIKFGQRMGINRGPLCFTQAQRWFFETYGWSAEIRQYDDIVRWFKTNNRWINPTPMDLPPECNPHWSWTNGYDDLRIYVATDAELTFFQLKFSQDTQ